MRYVVQRCHEAAVAPQRLVAVHADLGEMEWPGCPDLAGKQAEHYGLRFLITKRNGGDLLEYVAKRGKWPSSKARYCTSDFKRGPIRRVMTALVNESRSHVSPRSFPPVRILNCMGMRAQESPARSKLQPLTFNASASNGRREVWDWLPIHPWPIEEVWSDIRKSGVPHHEAYDLGMPRLSCCFCIFAPPAALMLAGKHQPELLARYVAVEQSTGHSFREKLSLTQIQKAIQTGQQAGEVTDWKM